MPAPWRVVQGWVRQHLRRKLAVALLVSLTFASVCFLAILVLSYRARMLEERSAASTEINRLLQAGLENAMLARDIAGLRQMVERLGRQDRVRQVMILAPTGEVRFSSVPAELSRRWDLSGGELCPGCEQPFEPGATQSVFVAKAGGDVLRSINPVPNREPCTECHGPVAVHPINGILVVDYDGAQIRQDTLSAVLALSSSGLVVVLTALGFIAWVLQRTVLRPVARLTEAASALSLGRTEQLIPVGGDDEIARLGAAFNAMGRRIAEGYRQLDQRERTLQVLIDAIPDGVRVIDRDYKVLKANTAFCTQQGLTLEQVIGRPCHATSHGRGDPCPPTLVTCPLHEMAGGRLPLVCRHRHRDAVGEERAVEVSAAPLEIEVEGQRRRVVVEVIRDLSREMRISQEQRLSEIGYLAAGVAHEIHNPLTSIHLGFDMVNRELAEGRHEMAAQYIRIIEEQIARCIDVTSRLLKLSAAPDDKPELIDLEAIVSDTLSLLTAEAVRSGVELTVDMAAGLRIIGSDSEMRMLVLNIAQNALHAMPNGGRLTVRGRRQGATTLTLEFEDTGVGIAPEDLGRIFDPFWSRRADGVRGTGLGLPICVEILKRAHGSIKPESELGKGTRFVVTLPSADRASPS